MYHLVCSHCRPTAVPPPAVTYCPMFPCVPLPARRFPCSFLVSAVIFFSVVFFFFSRFFFLESVPLPSPQRKAVREPRPSLSAAATARAWVPLVRSLRPRVSAFVVHRPTPSPRRAGSRRIDAAAQPFAIQPAALCRVATGTMASVGPRGSRSSHPSSFRRRCHLRRCSRARRRCSTRPGHLIPCC